MENATDALKLAFAVMFFVGAISLAMMTFTQARVAAEFILYVNDRTNYFEYEYGNEQEKDRLTNRIVGLETIIPTLYRYYKENYTVIFRDKNGTEMSLYQTKYSKWLTTENIESLKKDNRPTNGWIGRFDLAEEVTRGEMWTGNPDKDTKLHLDAIIFGKKYPDPNGNANSYMNYTTGLIHKFANMQFYESLGEYEYERQDGQVIGETSTTIIVDGEIVDLVKQDVKRVITYTQI